MGGLGFNLDNWVGLGLGKCGKKSSNPLAHSNPLQMGASPIRPN